MHNTILIFINLAFYYSNWIETDINDEYEQCFTHTDGNRFTSRNIVLAGRDLVGLVMFDQEMNKPINFCHECGPTFALIDEN